LNSAYGVSSTASTNAAGFTSGVTDSHLLSTPRTQTRLPFAERPGSVKASTNRHGGSRFCSVTGLRTVRMSIGLPCFRRRASPSGSRWISRTGIPRSIRGRWCERTDLRPAGSVPIHIRTPPVANVLNLVGVRTARQNAHRQFLHPLPLRPGHREMNCELPEKRAATSTASHFLTQGTGRPA